MILNQRNCSNSLLWGKELKFIIDGEIVDELYPKIEFPSELDFIQVFHPKHYDQAKSYYKS